MLAEGWIEVRSLPVDGALSVGEVAGYIVVLIDSHNLSSFM